MSNTTTAGQTGNSAAAQYRRREAKRITKKRDAFVRDTLAERSRMPGRFYLGGLQDVCRMAGKPRGWIEARMFNNWTRNTASRMHGFGGAQ